MPATSPPDRKPTTPAAWSTLQDAATSMMVTSVGNDLQRAIRRRDLAQAKVDHLQRLLRELHELKTVRHEARLREQGIVVRRASEIPF